MKKIFSIFAALTLSVGLWAETVITYTASQKLGDKLWSQLLGTYQHDFVGNNGTITIQGELSTIPEKVFSKSTYLQTIILPECVTSIGENAFLMCSSLQSIAMPKVTTIEHDAFRSCGSLSSIELPNVTTIGRQAFSLCTSLLSIELPKVVSIEHSAFLGSALQSVTFLSTSCTIDDLAFEGVGSAAKPATLVLPDNWTGAKPAQDGSWYGGYFTMPVSTMYLDENGETQTVDANEITSSSATLAAGWYVVKGTDVQTDALTCQGAVHIILADGAKLTATTVDYWGPAGINVTGANSLTIYAQSTGEQMGQLIATGGQNAAGIGGNEGQPGSNITINGGKVTATGTTGGAAIGGGYGGVGSNITINGGKVTATASGYHTTAIGSGQTLDPEAPDPTASNIFVATTLQVKADGNNPPTTVIENTGSDLASSLLHKFYVVIEPKSLPDIKAAAIAAVNGAIAEGDNLYVKEIATRAVSFINAATNVETIEALKTQALSNIASAKAAYGEGETAGYNTGYTAGEEAGIAVGIGIGYQQAQDELPTEGDCGPTVIITKGDKTLTLYNVDNVEYKVTECGGYK